MESVAASLVLGWPGRWLRLTVRLRDRPGWYTGIGGLDGRRVRVPCNKYSMNVHINK